MPKQKIPRSRQMQMRREKVRTLKSRGYSNAEIGKLLHPQVTGQAVGRMLARMGVR